MALTEIEYGALASSEVMNNNFNYLDNRINSVSETLISNNAGLNSNIASISSTLSSFTDKVNTDIEKINEDLTKTFANYEESGSYITTYVNGSSWYREYFSDAEKKNRVWVEQGGQTATLRYITFLKPFKDTNYCVQTQRTSDTYEYSTIVSVKSTTSCYVDCRAYGNGTRYNAIDWYACGK